ncbi:MAG: tRNA uridine-5-carboxymethylaminomethyl(34) synthesis GTPase MnmE [Bacilli bacterium]|nr:tRNA uridine-5-carboxymethylaminomethyl(34) synthesis GTPase MnmE [Bacilli bacterium]
MVEDTICAIATSVGNSGISIIRVSGANSFKIVNKITKIDVEKMLPNTIKYTKLIYKDELIDEVLISKFVAPKSFTAEDIIEINTHGGIASTNKVLEILLELGVRLATPGEFTKRAFLNGRINLIEAEASNDLIVANTDYQRVLAVNKLNGSLTKQIEDIREKLVSIIANIEVNIDYPEYEDIEVLTNEKIVDPLTNIKKDLELLLKNSYNGKIINNGINVALIGKPNVGKSSILNRLLGEEKAIVTNIAGTTRDIVEGSIELNKIKYNFIDTAGIRETKDYVEQIGVEKSKQKIEEADLIILILNNNESLTNEEQDLLNNLQDKKAIIFINKNDLDTNIALPDTNIPVIKGNTIDIDGLQELKDKIIEMYNLGDIKLQDLNYITNTRQINLVKEANRSIENALNMIKENTPIDLITIDINDAWNYLGEIIGKTYKEDLLDELFSRFCLGK